MELLQIWNMEEPEIPLQSQHQQNSPANQLHNTTNEVSDDLSSITVNDLLTSNNGLTDNHVPEVFSKPLVLHLLCL